MRALKNYYFLFLAVFMLAAKPFVGFDVIKHNARIKTPGILVKAFTKRKQEYVEDSPYDTLTIQKKLANPLLILTILFSALLNFLFPLLFRKVKDCTNAILSSIYLSLFPPEPRYLLSGKMII